MVKLTDQKSTNYSGRLGSYLAALILRYRRHTIHRKLLRMGLSSKTVRFEGVRFHLYCSSPSEKPPLLLTMAGPSGDFWGKWINYEEVVDSFDFIACMTYDYHGEWSQHSGHNSPLYTCHNDPCGSFNDSYSYLLRRQIPPEKLLLGIPFFGRSFDCRDLYQKFNESHYYSYSEVMDILDSGWSYIWDDCSEVPYLRNQDETEIISFDDEHSVSLKCEYIKNRQIAGIIIWELTQDYYKDSSVLLEVIGKELKAK